MKRNSQKFTFYFTSFCIYLYICISINTNVVDGNLLPHGKTNNPKVLHQINPTSNGRPFDTAKEAMNLITRVDLPTCRCVNFEAGKLNNILLVCFKEKYKF